MDYPGGGIVAPPPFLHCQPQRTASKSDLLLRAAARRPRPVRGCCLCAADGCACRAGRCGSPGEPSDQLRLAGLRRVAGPLTGWRGRGDRCPRHGYPDRVHDCYEPGCVAGLPGGDQQARWPTERLGREVNLVVRPPRNRPRQWSTGSCRRGLSRPEPGGVLVGSHGGRPRCRTGPSGPSSALSAPSGGGELHWMNATGALRRSCRERDAVGTPGPDCNDRDRSGHDEM